MQQIKLTDRFILLLLILAGLSSPAAGVIAAPPQANSAQSSEVTAFDLIIAMNTLRASYGLPALVEDPIIDAVAQSTAATMAANEMSWHIGNVSGRLAASGYGGGAKVWGTENFAVCNNESIDQIMLVWSDASHMIPAVNPAYCNIGAGIAKAANGMTYYILQAAYTAAKSCGEYKSVGGPTTERNGTTDQGRVGGVSQLIVAVKIATPEADGKVFHVVQAGQSFWAIAVAYKITIKDLETWNNLSKDSKLQIGQRLFIPGSNTAGYSTPTPVGMIQVGTPDADGKIVHTVQSYQTLTTIAQAYGITIQTILALNGIQVDWPLQIGQKLVVNAGNITPSPTPKPLTPLEKLTPASDGKYYHSIQSGETLSWIAGLYNVSVFDLMAWNGLNEASILQPEQKLLLQVTPLATVTPTPAPVTDTPIATQAPPSPTPSLTTSRAAASPTAVPGSSTTDGSFPPLGWLLVFGVAAAAFLLAAYFVRRR